MLERSFRLFKTIFLLGVVSFCGCEQNEKITLKTESENKLMQYYNESIKLSDEELADVCNDVKNTSSSGYLLALANYYTGMSLFETNEKFNAFEAYDSAFVHLKNSNNITDPYLKSAILQYQGVILKQHGSMDGALTKYKEALSYAEKHSMQRELSIKHNIGRVLVYIDPERALDTFLEIIDQAEKEGLNDRVTKSYMEIGQIFIIAKDYESAKDYFEKALTYVGSDEVRASAIHSLSQVFFYQEDFKKQEALLLEALALEPNRYISLIDLGECYMMQGLHDKATFTLKKAENLYGDQQLIIENTKLFKWLAAIDSDSSRYWKVRGDELEKIVVEKEKLESLLKKQAMDSFMEKMAIKQENEEKVGQVTFYSNLSIIAGTLALLILLTWRIWWYRLKRSLAGEIEDVLRGEIPH